MLPKLYHISHPRTPWQVAFLDPSKGRVRKHFADEAEARKYQRELLAKAKIAGTAGLVLDARMRDEYHAAVSRLDGVPLSEAVTFYLQHHPVGVRDETLVDAVEAFLGEKKRAGRAVKTLINLACRLERFLAMSGAQRPRELNRELIQRFLDGLDVAALTRRHYQTCLSGFCGWLMRRGLLAENPVKLLEMPKVDPPSPSVLTPDEADKVMLAAVDHREGIFALYFALSLFAGLRSGEIQRLTWKNVMLDGETPMIRVEVGKKRGRRAVRLVPIAENLKAWLKWGRGRELELCHQPLESARTVRSAVTWQGDICRHSWISYRLALVSDEARVAREAGNSPDVIWRHYFQLVTEADARRFFAIVPCAETVRSIGEDGGKSSGSFGKFYRQ
jgi:integrase